MRRSKQTRRPQPKPKLPPGESELRRRIRQRYDSNPFEFLVLDANTFHRELPTAAERRAFIAEFRDEYLSMFGFIAPETMQPADIEFEFNVFKRPPEFFENLPLSIELPDLPDLRSIPRGPFERNHYEALAKVRGEWWKVNRIEMTDEELIWMVRNG